MNRVGVVLAAVFVIPLLSCGGDDPTSPDGWTVVLDSHDSGAWQVVESDPFATFADGVFSVSAPSHSAKWRSRRLDLGVFREARLRGRAMLPGPGAVFLILESNVPGTPDLAVADVLSFSTADSLLDVSLENALGFHEASLLVVVGLGMSDGSAAASLRDLQIVGRR